MGLRAAWGRLPDWAQDVMLAALITCVQVQGTVSRVASDPATVVRPLADAGLGYALLIASGVVVAVRRRFPVAAFVVAGLASIVYYGLDYPDGPGWIGLFVTLYTLTALGDGRRSLLIAGWGIMVLTVCWLLSAVDLQPRAAIGWVFFRIGASVMSAALGESVRSRRVITYEAVQRAELAERTREEVARARVAQERLRIAREVHDTVAHAIAVINVQAGVAAHVLDKRPDGAREALVAIEHTSARALQEMRTVLDVLRTTPQSRTPEPGVDRVDELVEHARDAGLDITLNRPPLPTGALPSAVDAAAYRIVQEAVTNVIRHVGPTRVVVDLECGPESLEIAVTDEGRPDHPGSSGVGFSRGHGLQGMRERCELLGGQLVAGPLPEAGFEVRARFPLAVTAATSA